MHIKIPMGSVLKTLAAGVLCIVSISPAQAQGSPSFSTRAAVSGMTDSHFVVFLPLVNSGTAAASNVQVSAVTLSGALLSNIPLPTPLASTFSPGDYRTLDLQFAKSSLGVGSRHLLTVRGSYQVAGQVFGFAVNQFITITVPDSALLTQIQHWVAMDAVTSKANTLPGLDAAADDQAMLTFIQSLSDFVESGIDVPSSTVWATFADGTKFIFGNDRVTQTSSGTATQTANGFMTSVAPRSFTPAMTNVSSFSPAPQITEIPASADALLMNTLQTGEYQGVGPINDISSWLKTFNYTPNIQDPSVDNLRNVGGLGVLYFASHGGFHGKGTLTSPMTFGVWTTTKADIIRDDTIPVSDRFGTTTSPPTLTYFDAKADTVKGQSVYETHYAITAQFVRTYWTAFSDNSFVYIDACSSDDPRLNTQTFQGAQDFKQAVLSKNVSVYAGWTEDVDDGIAAFSARLVFDRFLGANQVFLESLPTPSGEVFKQRPFDWKSVLVDLPQHNFKSARTGATLALGIDPSSGAHLAFTPNPDMVANSKPVFGLLAPSISYMLIEEPGLPITNAQLVIGGLFGSRESDIDVTVGGQPAAQIQDNFGQSLFVTLPTLGVGSGSSGEVLVAVATHQSNPARVTEWQGPFTFTMATGTAQTGKLNQTITMTPAFRADIREYRPVIHQPPVEPQPQAMGTMIPGTTGNYSCNGVSQWTQDGNSYTETWFGNSNLTPSYSSSGDNFFALSGGNSTINQVLTNTTIGMQFLVGGNACMFTTHTVFPGPPETVIDFGPSPLQLYLDSSGPYNFILSLDPATAAIQAPPNPLQLPNIPCGGPPPYTCTGFFQWNLITPVDGTAPDPNSPR